VPERSERSSAPASALQRITARYASRGLAHPVASSRLFATHRHRCSLTPKRSSGMSDGDHLAELRDDNAQAPRRARGGKGSRARRLEKYNELQREQTLMTHSERWVSLTLGALRLHRANLRDAARAGQVHLRSARTKIRRAVWRAWTFRSLKIAGPRLCVEGDFSAACFPIRGNALEPLSRRDMWVLKRASALARRAVPELVDPEEIRSHRHVLDWLQGDGDMTHTREAAAKLMAESLQPKAKKPKQRGKSKSKR